MDKYEIVRRIENFAPPETAEKWDCSGWLVETEKREVTRIMLALTVTDDILAQAKNENCDMIISHHPLFEVPLNYKNIDIYCAHTNMDLARGGTTDTLIEKLKNLGLPIKNIIKDETFVRYVETDISFEALAAVLSEISPNFRYADKGAKVFKKLAFCAGSGSEFISDAFEQGADGYITGDLKFHTALDSPITVFDVGHFESEIQVLEVFKHLISEDAVCIYAAEKSPLSVHTM
ncbi:Nif3-like dinuclear metal center hexameric protein [bacterium]|nr:Nif3-like dinuclear metal center hexameric protein [bacterium]